MLWTPDIEITCEDCMDLMARYPDKHFDLAVVDPPYGIARAGQEETFTKNPKHKRKHHENKGWDNAIPTAEYFKKLERISKNQIVWGANYFVKHLTKGTMGWMVWDKGQHGLSMSDCELAYSSFNKATRVFTFNRGLIAQKGGSIHPTQKPVKLYEWIFKNYAEQGQTILDTHLGSGSIAIAAHNYGMKLTGCELDREYYEAAHKRFKTVTSQAKLF